jgi:hypothetical protein
MTLLERPKSTRIDNLLNEILKPYDLRADHNMRDGGYRVKPLKKKKKKVAARAPFPGADKRSTPNNPVLTPLIRVAGMPVILDCKQE